MSGAPAAVLNQVPANQLDGICYWLGLPRDFDRYGPLGPPP